MSDDGYSLEDYVGDLRDIAAHCNDDREVIGKVRPLARRLALSKTWLKPEHYKCNEEQGLWWLQSVSNVVSAASIYAR